MTDEHSSRFYGAEIDRESAQALRHMLSKIETGRTGRATVPGYLELTVEEIETDADPGDGSRTFLMQHRNGTKAIETTAGRGRRAEKGWRLARHGDAAPPPCPEGPWCADRLDREITKLPRELGRTALIWTTDFCQCLGWTILKTRRAQAP